MTTWGVLAGGRGRRYGLPKAIAAFGEGTFLDHCLRTIDAARAGNDVVAVSLARDSDGAIAAGRVVVRDVDAEPGPAHSIVRLAEFAMQQGDDLVFMAVDMLSVGVATLRSIEQRMADNRGSHDNAGGARVVVARNGDKSHWVLGGIPRELLQRIIDGGESVEAVQSLLRLCPLDYVEVPPGELLDVNTPDLLPGSSPIAFG